MRILTFSLLSALGCSSSDTFSSGGQDLTDGSTPAELVGSYSLAFGMEIAKLPIPDQPYATIASLILREDGSYYAQVSPRECLDEIHYIKDDHMAGFAEGMEAAGYWQGLEGTWKAEERDSGYEVSLSRVLRRDGEPLPDGGVIPSLVLQVELEGDTMRVTTDSYAGSINGGIDVLKKESADCRLERYVPSEAEREIDELEAELFHYGAHGSEVQGTSDIFDMVPTAGNTLENPTPIVCQQDIKEPHFRNVWRNTQAGLIQTVLQLHIRYDVFTSIRQDYFYDDAARLRVVVSTSVLEDPSTEIPVNNPITQTRIYYDTNGNVIARRVQPLIQQTAKTTQEAPFIGRRFDSLHHPIAIKDLPWCALPEGESPRFYAADPFDFEASLTAESGCWDL